MGMSEISFSAVAAAIIFGIVAGCIPPKDREVREDREDRKEREDRKDGSILYDPAPDPDLRPEIKTPVFVWSRTIVDDKTGYRLSKEWSRTQLPGCDDWLTIWKLDRSKENKPPVYIVTRNYLKPRNSMFGSRCGLEIVHAHVDGFFPFRDALSPADFSLERVVAMMDIEGQETGRKGYLYLDNRLAYRQRNADAEEARGTPPFRFPNFENRDVGSADIYFPNPASGHYDAPNKTVKAADGATLFSDNDGWPLGMDRSGMPFPVYATWSDKRGLNTVPIVMTPLRVYREGYGETRAVWITPDTRRARADSQSDGPRVIFPSGKSLADLINMSVPIAGAHAGHMVVIDSRAAVGGEWGYAAGTMP